MNYREMTVDEISRIGEVNREEVIEAEYVAEPDGSGFGIVAKLRHLDPPKRNPAWGKVGTEKRIRIWKPALDQGGCMIGAFHQDRLTGFVILGPARSDQSAEIVALFIDRDFRRKGIGSELMDRAVKKAQDREILALYLYANPTVASANFYLKKGFDITGLISKQIVANLPGDILMAKRLHRSS
ncbi:GNAT family N-acetyltransferase [Chloroflexi bacterium TSY]|nr:GNAT family N-acetyltransferase [Chloroflexi bacterium TSY]